MNVYIGEPIVVSDMQGPCPDGFHVPLQSEWQGLKTIMDGLGLTTGDGWRINLHMPFAGHRSQSNASLLNHGEYGDYWSSSPDSSSSANAYNLDIGSGTVYTEYGNYRAYGFSVRCFKDSFEVPTSSWTVINGTLGGAGIFWNQTEGLISITSNGTTGYTIQDKNLGATTVYNNGDTLTQANMGNMYQWGNNYGFPSTGSISKTSSSQVNAQNYGPGNYYSSSTFIKRSSSPYNRDSSNNSNLRGGVSQGSGTVSQELQNVYIGELYSGPLRFKAEEANSTIQLNKTGSPTSVTLETSRDGKTWSTYTFGTAITLSNIGDKVYFRNTSTTTTAFNIDYENRYSFTMTGSIAGSGDVTTLVNKNGTTTLVGTECFRRLFYNCTSLTSSPELPAKSLTNSCYMQMFSFCTSLTTVPELPATTLADKCYNSMFLGCTALTSAPELPASTMVTQCYYMMFRGCTALTTPPKLSSTALATNCYGEMFNGCTSLETLPKLPATTLADRCYYYMFYNCSKIKLSTTQTGEYQTSYRIPTTGTGSAGTESLSYMFYNTGGTYTSNPTINTTYYTSNTVV